jgi:hypothetical protein
MCGSAPASASTSSAALDTFPNSRTSIAAS